MELTCGGFLRGHCQDYLTAMERCRYRDMRSGRQGESAAGETGLHSPGETVEGLRARRRRGEMLSVDFTVEF